MLSLPKHQLLVKFHEGTNKRVFVAEGQVQMHKDQIKIFPPQKNVYKETCFHLDKKQLQKRNKNPTISKSDAEKLK